MEKLLIPLLVLITFICVIVPAILIRIIYYINREWIEIYFVNFIGKENITERQILEGSILPVSNLIVLYNLIKVVRARPVSVPFQYTVRKVMADGQKETIITQDGGVAYLTKKEYRKYRRMSVKNKEKYMKKLITNEETKQL